MSSKVKHKSFSHGFSKDKHQEVSDFLMLFMFFIPFFGGLSRPCMAIIAASVIEISLILTYRTKGSIVFRLGVDNILTLVIIAAAIITVFTGVSKGNSFIGLVLMLSIFVFYLFVLQRPVDEREKGLSLIPDAGVVMTVISAVLFIIPEMRDLISGNNRLWGFFGYSNTYALFLLIGIIVFSFDNNIKRAKWQNIAYPILLIIGILWSGSRTTIIMTAAVILIISIQKRELRRILLPILIAVVVGVFVIGVVLGVTDSFARVLTLSQSSTLIGRFLYWKDALKQIPSYPFGQGYLGYFLSHEALQHGVYTVRFVHNEWVQTIVDYGFVGFIAFIALIGRQIYKLIKAKSGLRLWVASIILIHMIMDMDLQFMVIVWILILCFEFDDASKDDSSEGISSSLVFYPVLAVLSALFIWIGTADFLFVIGDLKLSDSVFPWNAEVKDTIIVKAVDGALDGGLEEINKYSNEANSLYEYDSTAYDALSVAAYYSEDYIRALEYKYQAVLLQPYRTEEYIDFLDLAKTCRKEYSAEDELVQIEQLVDNVRLRIEQVESTTDPLAYKINDKPDFNIFN